MKKSIYIISILAAGLLLMVYSCSKEEAQTAKSHGNDLTPYEIQVHNAIKGFISTIEMHRENPHYKSGQVVSPDSALWLLEATINYSHAFPNEFYTEYVADTINLTVPLNSDGMVDLTVLTSKYNEMKLAVATVYHNSNFEEKGLAVVDLEESSIKEDQFEINVQVFTGEKGHDPPPPPPVNGPFNEGDDWWYGKNLGHCDNPGGIQEDAANHLFWETVGLVPNPNGNYFFINEFTMYLQGGDPNLLRDFTPDNYLDYWLYFAIEGSPIPFVEDEDLCVEWQEMNAYYVFLKGLMFDFLPKYYLPDVLNLHGYSVETFHELTDHSEVEFNGITKYYHKAKFTFGIKVYYFDGQGPSEI